MTTATKHHNREEDQKAQEAIMALDFLKNFGFLGRSQVSALRTGMRGEERQYFYDKIVEVADIARGMPATYAQDGMGDKTIVSLHYFTAGCDWYITEKDSEREQEQAFGLADIGYGPELGYISIVELLANGAELDLHFKPRTLAEIRK